MAQRFKEVAHLNVNKKKFNHNWDKIFNVEKHKKEDRDKRKKAVKKVLSWKAVKSAIKKSSELGVIDYDKLAIILGFSKDE